MRIKQLFCFIYISVALNVAADVSYAKGDKIGSIEASFLIL